MKNLTLDTGLVLLYGSILLFNILFSIILWRKTKSTHYKILAQGCLLLLITGVIQGQLTHSSYLVQVLAASTIFFGTFNFIKLLSLITGIKIQPRKYVVVYLAGVILSIIFNALDFHPSIMSLPALIGMGYSAFEMGIKSLLKKNNANFIVKCFAVAEFLRSLHNVDFSYAYVHTEWMVLGFTIAMVLIFATTTFATAAVLETITAENTKYKMEIEYGHMMANSERLAYLGQMANGMAHEINNPLAIIQLTTGQIKRRAAQVELDHELVVRNVSVIEDSVSRINKIIRGLQGFGRDAGQDLIERTSLSGILQETLFFMQERLKSKGIEVRIEGSSQVFVNCRPTQISQVITNLLNNAIHALSNNTGDKWIQFNISQEDGFVTLRISDNGSGISSEHQDKIFHPFFTTKDVGQGAGLGLSSSLGIIASNKGSLFLEQNSPFTTFVLKLPEA